MSDAPPRRKPRRLQRGRRTFFCLLGLLCSIPMVTAACALIVLAVKTSERRYASSKETPCCEEYVGLLSRIVNRTINPCKSAYDYACERYREEAALGAKGLIDSQTSNTAWGYRPSNTPAGKLAYKYYRSCVTAMVQGEHLGAQTASTLLEFLGPSLKSPARLIVEISLKYFIRFPVSFISENMLQSWHYPLPSRQFFNAYHIAVGLLSAYGPWMSKEALEIYRRIRIDALRRINEARSLNVSERELNDVAAALRVTTRLEYTASNLTALHKLIPAFAVGEWKELLENATGSIITGVVYINSDLKIMKRCLDTLLNPAAQNKSVVFSLVEAASRLLIGSVLEKDNRDMRKRYFAYCKDASSFMVRPLLIMDKMQNLNAGKLHDLTLQAHFRSIAEAVGVRAANLVAPEDVTSVRDFLNVTRLLLPSHVFRLDSSLPVLSGDFVRNYFVVRDSNWTLYNIALPNDIPRLQIMEATQGWKARTFRNVVILPVNAYAAVNITPSLDAVIPFGTIGMLMADGIWRSVFGSMLSDSTARILRLRSTCFIEEKIMRRRVRFYYPVLSFDATLDAARREHWGSTFRLYAHQLQQTSRRQLFFLLILFNYYCPVANRDWPLYRRNEANYLMRRSDDFREAFACTDKPVGGDIRRC